ncbi:MAG: hypothetical protein VKI83_10875 [Synechococcaceae cyanobacterium]|nr:hypothetical protein [Synechococcaceae cyanobacterium]
MPIRSLQEAVLAMVLISAGAPALAQSSANQPEAIRVQGLLPPPCPLIVPVQQAVTQPLRLQPGQVAAKNRMGCLSPEDASHYAANGCPARLCASGAGTIPLPGR